MFLSETYNLSLQLLDKVENKKFNIYKNYFIVILFKLSIPLVKIKNLSIENSKKVFLVTETRNEYFDIKN